MRKSKCKDFILKNFDKFEYDSINHHFFMPIKNSYYTMLTIKLSECGNDDRFYCVCYWGNRKSWLWYFKEDFFFCANIVSKTKHTDIDTHILNILKSKTHYYETNSK